MFSFFILRWSLCPQAGVQWHDLSLVQPLTPSSSDSPASASQVAGITGTHHRTQPSDFLVFMLYSYHGHILYLK